MSSNDDDGSSAIPSAIVHADEALVDGNVFDVTRTRLLTSRVTLPRDVPTKGKGGGGGGDPCVVYWMMRDVRTSDNWALLFAKYLAVERNVPLRVAYALPPPPPSPPTLDENLPPPKPSDMPYTERHGTFMLEGLRVVSEELSKSGVPFDILCPASRDLVGEAISSYCGVDGGVGVGGGGDGTHDAVACVCDMSPLRHHRDWTEVQAARLLEDAGVPLYQVRGEKRKSVYCYRGLKNACICACL
jgi:deoxyribodipyrimidine photo-lyase